MFAVVEDEQDLPLPAELGDALRHRQSGVLPAPDRLPDRGRDRIRGADFGQFTQPHPVGELVGDLAGCFQHESGLADAADSDDGHEVVGRNQFPHSVEVGISPDEGVDGGRQVALGSDAGTDRREVLVQIGAGQLVQQVRFGEALQSVETQVDEPEVAEVGVGDDVVGCCGDEDLITGGEGHDPGGPVDG